MTKQRKYASWYLMNFTTTVPNKEADELVRFIDLLLSILTLVVLPVQYKLS